MIESQDISIIVQGAINTVETKKCIKSIRKYLPDAEIILSTWENEPTENLDYDIIVLNTEPSSILIDSYKSKKIYNNLNKQLISTQNGLKQATKKYTLKIRSDLIIEKPTFLEFFDNYPKRIERYKLFEHKVIIPMLLTRYNYNKNKMPFHISDWWFFGLTNDIKKYFEKTKLVEEPNFTNYFANEENKYKKNPYGKIPHKFAPEQYFGYSCFARNFDDIYMEDASDYSEELMEKYRKCLLNNFIILDFKHSGIYLNKYLFSKNEKLIGDQYIDLYNPYRYQKDYKEICDNEFLITETPILEDKKTYSKMRIYKKLYRLIEHNLPINKKLATLFFELPYSIIMFILDSLKSNNSNL